MVTAVNSKLNNNDLGTQVCGTIRPRFGQGISDHKGMYIQTGAKQNFYVIVFSFVGIMFVSCSVV